MKITFSHRFEAAHRFLESSSSPCHTPHGHTWSVHLTLEQKVHHLLPQKNLTEDFRVLKKNWRTFIDEHLDHCIFLNSKDPLKDSILQLIPQARVKLTPGDPTTEALALIFFNKAQEIFKPFEHLKISSLKLQETPTNAIEVDQSLKGFDFL